MAQRAEPQLNLRQSIVLVAVTYTVLTVTSSAYHLLRGSTTDTHAHLLARFAVTSIGVGAFTVYSALRRRFPAVPPIWLGLASYALAMGLVLAGMWGLGNVTELHPDAYRDIVLNFTAVALGLVAIWKAVGRRQQRRAQGVSQVR